MHQRHSNKTVYGKKFWSDYIYIFFCYRFFSTTVCGVCYTTSVFHAGLLLPFNLFHKKNLHLNHDIKTKQTDAGHWSDQSDSLFCVYVGSSGLQ